MKLLAAFVLSLFLLGCSSTAEARDYDLEIDIDNPHPDLSSHPYNTEIEASLAAFKLVLSMNLNRVYEAGGLIVHDHRDNKYYITIPYETHQHGTITLPWDAYKGWDVTGTYHTHACVPHFLHGFFSIHDAVVGQYHRVNMYMMNMCTGNVYLYDYRVDPADDYQPVEDGQHFVLTRGRMVSYIPVQP